MGQAGGWRLPTCCLATGNVNDAGHRDEVERALGSGPGSIAPRPGIGGHGSKLGPNGARRELILWWVAAPTLWWSHAQPGTVRPPWPSAIDRGSVRLCRYENRALRHLLLPAAQWSEKQGTMTIPSGGVTFCPAFRRPKARPSRLGRSSPLLDAAGFRAQVSPTPSAKARSNAEHAQLSAGPPFATSPAQHELLASPRPQQWPLQGHAPTTEAETASTTDLLFPTRHGPRRSAPICRWAWAKPISEGYALVTHCFGRYLGPVAND